MRASQSPQSLSLSETNHNPKEVALAASSVLSYNGNRVLIKWLGRGKQLGELETVTTSVITERTLMFPNWFKLSLIGKSPVNWCCQFACCIIMLRVWFAPLKNQYNINFINSFSSDYLISYPSKSLGSFPKLQGANAKGSHEYWAAGGVMFGKQSCGNRKGSIFLVLLEGNMMWYVSRLIDMILGVH